MTYEINDIDGQRFSLNGIPYYKNFQPVTIAGHVKIVGVYDSRVQLAGSSLPSEYSVNGEIFPNASLLQEALLPILYTRDTLGEGGGGPAVDQNNIPRLKSIGTVTDASTSTLAAKINSLPTFIVGEKDIQYFSALVNTNAPASVASRSYLRQYKFRLLNLGKGTYGNEIGNILVTAANIEITFIQNPTIVYIQDEENTQTIDLGEIGDTPVSEAINSSDPAHVIQNQEEGYTIIQTLVDGNPVNYLFIGDGGTYGDGETQSTESDFQLLDQYSAGSTYRQSFTFDGDPFEVPENLTVTDIQNLTTPSQFTTFNKVGGQVFVTSYAENGDEFKILGNL